MPRMREESNETAECFAEYLRRSHDTYLVLCQTTGCYSEGTLSAARHTKGNSAARVQTAATFIGQGWRYDNGPLLPALR